MKYNFSEKLTSAVNKDRQYYNVWIRLYENKVNPKLDKWKYFGKLYGSPKEIEKLMIDIYGSGEIKKNKKSIWNKLKSMIIGGAVGLLLTTNILGFLILGGISYYVTSFLDKGKEIKRKFNKSDIRLELSLD
jgi:hypothetical protein